MESLYLWNEHQPYEKGNIFNKDPLRIRKLLLHRSEINKMEAKLKEKGLTLVPIKVYFKNSLVKVKLAWQEVRNCMTNVRISLRKIRDEKQSVISR